MDDKPINPNPGVTPSASIPPTGPNVPPYGPSKETTEKPFTFGPEGGGGPATPTPTQQRPTPMEVAGDTARQQSPQMPPEELSDRINNLQDQFGSIQGKLQDPNITQNFTSDHVEGMKKVTQLLNPDMQTIAKSSNGQFSPPQQKSGQGFVEFITQWLDGAQGTLGGALNYLQNTPKPDVTSYLKMQYAVQRATQRGELFASIVGSSVSGIKTIMSTQLG